MDILEKENIFKLACAIIPGMMSRYTKEEKSDSQVIADSFILAQEFSNELFKAVSDDKSNTKKD